ncbi:glycosyltransferase family 4 protein [Pseudalkalibacillus caeni]|uniref:Glycosyltransferase family 4 protein n=1 Tax=Exobacillus caeni TaxID=2574798 RepID=A0A5R9F7Q0_9BACL|nr:glycosyltransferase family 4 protein [Pseudalkalibacillus caeni]TLS35785.1 glycosyltransferase family 4 protein [Pseudalkalibacillus caeni]
MKNKVLFCATVDYHFKAFHIPYLEWFKKQGWEVHVAASGNIELPFVDKKFSIPVHRSPFKKQNLTAYKQLASIINKNEYKVIHCHTPMGGVLTRLAAIKSRKTGTKVLYTAHGFHFCKGAPLQNWMLYYPIEKVLASITDCLITINEEDYNIASQNFSTKKIELVHGVGVNVESFFQAPCGEKISLRNEMDFSNEDFILFYAAEFNKNKNQSLLIKALAEVKGRIPHVKLVLAGDGPLINACKTLARQYGVFEMVRFLGFKEDIKPFLKISDLAVASSLREGLPVNIIEAMSCGLPVIATKNRGHFELVLDKVNGYIVPPQDYKLFGVKIQELYQSEKLREQMGYESKKRVQKYSLNAVGKELSRIYSMYMGESNEADSKYNRSYI